MPEINKIEERFLEAMGIEKKGEMFFDNDKNRLFLFAGNHKTNYNSGLLKKDAFAYESGNDVLALINDYKYDREGYLSLTRGIRVSRGDLWYNLELSSTDSAVLSVARNYSQQVQKTIEPPAETPMIGLFRECYINPFEEPNLDYYYIFDTNKLSLWIPNIPERSGISLSITEGGWFKFISCDGETIKIDNDPNTSIEFNFENFVATVEKYVGVVSNPSARQTLNNAIEFMCCIVIPAMLKTEIDRRRKLIKSYTCLGDDCCEEATKLAILEKIYEEFAIYAIKDDVKPEKTIYKHVGEVRQ